MKDLIIVARGLSLVCFLRDGENKRLEYYDCLTPNVEQGILLLTVFQL